MISLSFHLHCPLERRFLFVIRKFTLMICRFFVVEVASVTALQLLQLVKKDESAMTGNVKDRLCYLDLFRLEGKRLIEFDLVKWLVRWSKGFIYLSKCEIEACTVTGKYTHEAENSPVSENEERIAIQGLF